MGIRAGTLKKRVQVQQRSTALDTFGGQLPAWVTIAVVWADIEPLSGRELFAAQAVNPEVSHAITVRYQPIFAEPKTVAAYRILYNGRIFNIHAAENQEERNRIMVFSASEGLNYG